MAGRLRLVDVLGPARRAPARARLHGDDRPATRHRERHPVSGGAADRFTLRYGQARVDATYIPNFGGGINHGSVLYVFGRVILD